MDPILLSDILDGEVCFFELASLPNEHGFSKIQIMKAGVFKSTRYGRFKIVLGDMKEIVKNFEKFRMGGAVRVDYNHLSEKPNPTKEEGKAAGWIQKLVLAGDKLFAIIKWTPNAQKLITNEEYKFISPAYAGNYEHSEGGRIGNWLSSIALTNSPFLKGMEPVALSEEAANANVITQTKEGNNKMDFEKIIAEQKAELEKLKKELAEGKNTAKLLSDANEKLKKLEADAANAKSDADKKKLEDDKNLSDSEISIKRLSEQNETQAEEIKTLKDDRKSDKADALIAKYVGMQKLSKAEIDGKDNDYRQLATDNPEMFERLMKNKPVVAPVGEEGSAQTPKELADGDELTKKIDERYKVLKKELSDTDDATVYRMAMDEVMAAKNVESE